MATATDWRRRVARWRASGESARVFAGRWGWNARTLTWWASRLRHGKVGRPGFVELVATNTRTAGRVDAIEVVLASGVRIQVRAGFDADVLRAVVQALESR